MKKLNLLVAVTALLLLSACRFRGRHTTIIENANGSTVKIEYRGQIWFTEDGQGIKSISPYGFVKYNKNGQDLLVENNDGKLFYELNGGDKQARLNNEEKIFVAQAVKEMIKYGHNTDGR